MYNVPRMKLDNVIWNQLIFNFNFDASTTTYIFPVFPNYKSTTSVSSYSVESSNANISNYTLKTMADRYRLYKKITILNAPRMPGHNPNTSPPYVQE